MRRDFALPEEDAEWLDALPNGYELVREGNLLRVVVRNWPVPSGYTVAEVDVNVRIEAGYPDAQIDMAYFHPDLVLASGRPIGALAQDQFDGRTWQRWSRHRTPANPWRPGIDNVATHFALIDDWLERELRKV
ncbi:E2/UBC family protein [Sphingomonas sp.]|uniref:E2/UBC family protein n=1 Tax=Sphingomonas sp. TaxID=28214 RepID=UPI003F70AD8D